MEVSATEQRKDRMSRMRQTLKASPLIRKATMPVEAKLEKNRKKSASLDAPLLDKSYADSESESQKEDETAFNQRYRLGEKIGEGAHGVVRACFCKSTGERLAVKSMVLDQEHMLYLKDNFIDIKRLRHPHVISYKAIFFEVKNEKCLLVMDYLPFPDLLSIQINSEAQLKEIVWQILQTLAYVHSHQLCHRDIKPENIMYDRNNNKIILVDFGISKKVFKRNLKRDMLTLTGTPYYRAPEMFEGGGYDERVDMWALGVTVFKLMAGYTPFEAEYHSDTIDNIMRAELSFPPEVEAKYSKAARMFVSCLLKRRKERYTANEAKKDFWFNDLHHNEDFIRSVTMVKKADLSGKHFEACESLEVPYLLWRTHTGKQSGPQFDNKSRQQIVRSLKNLDNVEQQESMIYGYQDETLRNGTAKSAL